MDMRRLSRDKYIYKLRADSVPAYQVELGETFIVEVWDAFAGQYTVRKDGIEREANPATGPIYIRGISPGDIVAIEILDVKTVDQGLLHTEDGWKVMDIVDGLIRFNDRLGIPVQPMIGVLGIAPTEGELDCRTPSEQGGNMDTNDVCAGSTVCLTAEVPGGLLMLGDVHARMGEGETNGMGVEVAADITLRITKYDQKISSRPFILREDGLMCVVSEELLDDAAWGAVSEMRKIVMALLGVDADEARLLVGVLGDLRISQIVNPKKTVRLEMPLVKTGDKWHIKVH